MAPQRIDGPFWAPTPLGTIGPSALLGEYVRRGDRLIYSPFRAWYKDTETIGDALENYCRDAERPRPFEPPSHTEEWFRYSSDQSELTQYGEIGQKAEGNVPTLAVLVQRKIDAKTRTLLGFSLATPWHADDRLAYVKYVWTNEALRRQLTESEYRSVRLGLMTKLATALARAGVLAVTALLPSPAKLGQVVSPYRAAFPMQDVLKEHGLSETIRPGRALPRLSEFSATISDGEVRSTDLACANDSASSQNEARSLIADAVSEKVRQDGWGASHTNEPASTVHVSGEILLDRTVSITVGLKGAQARDRIDIAPSSFRAPLARLAEHLRTESR